MAKYATQFKLEVVQRYLAGTAGFKSSGWLYSQDHAMLIYAPTDGSMRNVRLATPGGMAKAGEEIRQSAFTDDVLLIEAKVKPAGIAFIKPGLPAAVKLVACDDGIDGRLRGAVSDISADTLSEDSEGNEQPYSRAQMKTSGCNGKGKNGEPILIQPGMTASVEINTGHKTGLRYRAKPIAKTFSESPGERWRACC